MITANLSLFIIQNISTEMYKINPGSGFYKMTQTNSPLCHISWIIKKCVQERSKPFLPSLQTLFIENKWNLDTMRKLIKLGAAESRGARNRAGLLNGMQVWVCVCRTEGGGWGADEELCEFSQAQRKEKVMEREWGKESWPILGALPANDKCVL